MVRRTTPFPHRKVSLFTREWIEITLYLAGFENGKPSPSLRGSGLKSMIYFENQTREMSPSLRGSGLKCSVAIRQRILKESPSLRGSGLKFRQ